MFSTHWRERERERERERVLTHTRIVAHVTHTCSYVGSLRMLKMAFELLLKMSALCIVIANTDWKVFFLPYCLFVVDYKNLFHGCKGLRFSFVPYCA